MAADLSRNRPFDPRASSITIRTTKPDHDRYLADVFVEARRGEEVFVNNALLEHSNSHFNPERDCVVPTSRSTSA